MWWTYQEFGWILGSSVSDEVERVRVTRRCRGSCELQFSLHGRIQGSVWASGRALVLARRSCGQQLVDAEGLWVGGDEKRKEKMFRL